MAPSTTKQWKVVRTDKGFDGLEFEDAFIPSLGENDVLVRFHAVSLNFRDLMIPRVG
jgi:NADPH:quinone reductase-like Zn-dependent oxidoreductase